MEKLKAIRNPLKTNIDDMGENGRIKMSSQVWSREIRRIPNNNRIKTR